MAAVDVRISFFESTVTIVYSRRFKNLTMAPSRWNSLVKRAFHRLDELRQDQTLHPGINRRRIRLTNSARGSQQQLKYAGWVASEDSGTQSRPLPMT